jgi:hypothetical protein
MRKVNMETYLQDPQRYELRRGDTEGAPLCPYGNHFQWIGFDRQEREYVRFTKSVFKFLIRTQHAQLD